MKRIFSYALLLVVALSMGLPANAKKKEIAFQMYSVRDLIGDPGKYAKNHESTLKQLAAMGYTAVEAAHYGDGKLYGVTPEQFKADIEAAGLKVLSSHVGHNLNDEELASGNFQGALAWWDQCIAAHKAAGMKYLVNPGVNYPRNLKEAQVICDYLNKIGERANAAGLKFGYHNHSHEFNKVEGKVWYDYMIEHTDPTKVFFEMDGYWAVRGQVSPVEYFKKYPGRFTLLHVKDHTEIGQSGMVGFDAIFKNAETAGLKGWVVELEHGSSADILEGMKLSADYLKAAKFVKPSYE